MTLNEIKQKISTLRMIEKMTSSMQLMSSIKVRKFQKDLKILDETQKALDDVKQIVNSKGSVFISKEEEVLVLANGSDRGLCGNFNHVIQNNIQNHVKQKFFFAGKKLFDKLKLEEQFISGNEETIVSRFVEIATDFIFSKADPKVVFLEVKNKFGSCFVEEKKIFPFEITSKENHIYTFDASQEEIGIAFLKKFICLQIRLCYFSNKLNENISRVLTMDSGNKNVKKTVLKSQIYMNKMRQNRITAEMNEIVSGMES